MPPARLTFWQLRYVAALMSLILLAIFLVVIANRPTVHLRVLVPGYLPKGFSTAVSQTDVLTSGADRDLMIFGEPQLPNPFQRRELGVWIVRDEDGPPRLWQIGGPRRGRHLRIHGSPAIYFDDRGDKQVSWTPNTRLRIDLQTGSLSEAELLRIARSSSTSSSDVAIRWLPRGLIRLVRVNDYCNMGACKPLGYTLTYQVPHAAGVTVGVMHGGAGELTALRWFKEFRDSEPVSIRGGPGLLAHVQSGAKEVAWLEQGEILRWVSAYGVDSSELIKVARSLRPRRKA